MIFQSFTTKLVGEFNSKLFSLILLVLGVLLVLPTSVLAFNQQLNYQGKLTTSLNAAVPDGNYTIVFSLYTVSSGGTNIWTETQTVSVTNGLFSTLLGSVNSLSSVNFNQPLYLGVKVGTDAEMTPRKTLGAVPAAFEADKLDGFDATNFFKLASTTDDLTEGVTNQFYSDAKVGTYLNLQNKGYFFSTTSANYWGNLQGYLTSYTETDPLYAAASSTLLRAGTTTDALTEGLSNLFFTSTRVNDLINASSTIAKGSCASNEILKWSGSAWICAIDMTSSGSGGASLFATSSDPTVWYPQLEANEAIVIGSSATTSPNLRFEVGGNAKISGHLFVTGNATVTNATTTSFYSATLSALTSTFTNLFFSTASGTNLMATNATMTNATTTSFYTSALSALTSLFTNLIATNATVTNATTTNLTIGSLSGLLKATSGAVSTAVAGVDYVLPTSLSNYLGLSAWYATTTDGLAEGLTHKYADQTKENNGQTAFSWGNHALAGYLSNLLGGLNGIFGNTTTTNATTTSLSVTNLSAGTTTLTNLSVTNLSTSTFAGGLTVGTSNFVVQQATGNVGVGSSSPFYLFSVSAGGRTNTFGVDSSGNVNMGVGNIIQVPTNIQANTNNFIRLYNGSTGGMDFVSGSTNFDYPFSFTQNGESSVVIKSKNVGIGTTTPWAKLSIGLSNQTSIKPLLVLASSSLNVSTSTLFLVNGDGNIGIGTTTPNAMLTIGTSTNNTTDFFRIASSTNQNVFVVDKNGNFGIGMAPTATDRLTLNGNISASGALYASDVQSATAYFTNATTTNLWLSNMATGSIPFIGALGQLSQNNSNLFWDNTNARLGVGTTSPGSKLHITNGTGGGSIPSASNDVLSLENNDNAFINIVSPSDKGAGIIFSDGVRAVGQVIYRHTTDQLALFTSGTQKMVIDTNGNVGIGTTTPNSLLSVANTGTRQLMITDSDSTANAKHWWLQSSAGDLTIGTTSDSLAAHSSYLTIKNGGFVGIGTVSPLSKTEITGPLSTSVSTDILTLSRKFNSGVAYGSAASFKLSNPNSGFTNTRLDISLLNGLSDALPDTTVMTLLSSGFVGINKITPSVALDIVGTASSSALQVNGNGVFTGSLTVGGNSVYTAGGTDVAVADGGTGLSSYAIGDLIYASGATTLSKLADVAVGSYLKSGGVGVAPSWATLDKTAVGLGSVDNTADAAKNVLSATKWTTARSFTTTGDVVVSSTNWDGSGNFTAAATIGANKVNGTHIALGSDATGDIMYYNGTDWVRLAGGSGYLKSTGAAAPTWSSVTAGAAGALGQVQFNLDGSAMGASSDLFWDNYNKILSIGTSTNPNSGTLVAKYINSGGPNLANIAIATSTYISVPRGRGLNSLAGITGADVFISGGGESGTSGGNGGDGGNVYLAYGAYGVSGTYGNDGDVYIGNPNVNGKNNAFLGVRGRFSVGTTSTYTSGGSTALSYLVGTDSSGGIGGMAVIENTASSNAFAGFNFRIGGVNAGGVYGGTVSDAFGLVDGLNLDPGSATKDIGFRVGSAAFGGTATGPSMTIKSTGYVLIQSRLALAAATPDANAKYALTLPNNVSTGYGRGVAWDTYSDSRIKTEQQPLNYGLQDLLKLRPKSYVQHSAEIKNGKIELGEGKETIGLIAQEVYGVIPEAVNKPVDENQSLWGIEYDKLTPVIIKAIQELASQNKEILARLGGGFNGSTSTSTAVFSQNGPVDNAEDFFTKNNIIFTDYTNYNIRVNNVLFEGAFLVKGGTTFKGTLLTMGRAGFLSDVYFESGVEFKSHIKVDKGITIRDRATGEDYCVYVENGQTKTTKGDCDTVFSTPISNSSSSGQAGNSNIPMPSNQGSGSSGSVSTTTSDSNLQTSTSSDSVGGTAPDITGGLSDSISTNTPESSPSVITPTDQNPTSSEPNLSEPIPSGTAG